MTKKLSLLLALNFYCSIFLFSQNGTRPKLVVGVVVDQMRYDYMYRYWDKYGDKGFKRLINKGYSFENMQYDYAPTYTGPGHAAVYTGAPPILSGIAGNEWYNRELKRPMYVVEDSSVQIIGANKEPKGSTAKPMSPKNLLVTTIGDEMKLFFNQKSKVIGVALKDRGSILPAGHSADGAYWMDYGSGNFVTSSHYMSTLPNWVTEWNNRKFADQYLNKKWETLLPIEQYTESTADDNNFEHTFKTENGKGGHPVFPYNLQDLRKTNGNFELISSTPFGNSITTDFAISALINENMGNNMVGGTDLMAISYSSTDYIGHKFGPNSVEVEDTYLRLDNEIARLLDVLDQRLGAGNYLFFLTADHAAAHNPTYLQSLKIPAGGFDNKKMLAELKQFYLKKYGSESMLESYDNQQIYLNRNLIEEKNLDFDVVAKQTAHFLLNFKGVMAVYPVNQLALMTSDNNPIISRLQLGFNAQRSGDVVVLLEPAWYESATKTPRGTTHGTPFQYDTHVPMLFFGHGISPGHSSEEVHISDIAPTLAALLHIQAPNGSIGKVIIKY
jgi:predicted AlkP superfamily pyrophosphatase or phosphodiesterase